MHLPRAVAAGSEPRLETSSAAQSRRKAHFVRLRDPMRQADATGTASAETPPFAIAPVLASRMENAPPILRAPARILAILRLQSHKTISRETARAHGRSMLGALERARQLGLDTDVFDIGEQTCPWRCAARMLAGHGVRGAIILAEDRTDLPKRAEWRSLHAVAIGPMEAEHGLPWVSVDHEKAIRHAIRHAAQTGFTRPGLMLRSSHSQETRRRWEKAFATMVREEMAGQAESPSLNFNPSESGDFARWIHEHRLDVVLTTSDCRPRLEAPGKPQIQFVALDAAVEIATCLGLDQCHEQIGATAVDLVAESIFGTKRLKAAGVLLPPLWLDAVEPDKVSLLRSSAVSSGARITKAITTHIEAPSTTRGR